MPKLDLDSIPSTNRTGYPEPFAGDVVGRFYRRLAPAAGLTDFGASHVALKPGALSSQRHWHVGEDELVIMISGEAVLLEDEGETALHAGDVIAFPKGVANGHHIINWGEVDCVFVAIGLPVASDCHYPDIDLHFDSDGDRYTRMDGTPY